MTADEIAKMDYKQLRNTVIELNDNYIKLKRMLDDTLYNIDTSNLATTFRKEINGYKSEFKITAEEISSKVEHIEDNLEQYSTIKQTADKIEMAVNENRDYTDGQTQQLQSTFTMTASQISTNVVKVNNKTEKYYSEMKQTAEEISMIVGKVIKESFEMDTKPTAENTDEDEKQKICIYNNKSYYWNSIAEKWLGYDGNEEGSNNYGGIKSAFSMTADGIVMTGYVKVQGEIDMRENAEIGKRLILHDLNPYNTGSNTALTIAVHDGYAQITAHNNRSIELQTAHGNLTISAQGLLWKGKTVLTE